MISQAVAYEKFLSWDSVREMGWWNLAWIILIAFLVLAARAKKIGATSIGKNEWGMLEIFGFPLIPIPFGLWPFMKGIFHVKQVSIAPVRIDILSRREINNRVLQVNVTVLVRVTCHYQGSALSRFSQLRRDLIAAMYGTYDENMDDAENQERIEQTKATVEAAARNIYLKNNRSVDALTTESLRNECGEGLKTRFGEYIDVVYIREDAPVDGQLWKEARANSFVNDPFNDFEIPPTASV